MVVILASSGLRPLREEDFAEPFIWLSEVERLERALIRIEEIVLWLVEIVRVLLLANGRCIVCWLLALSCKERIFLH